MQSEIKKSVIICHIMIMLLLAAAAFGVQLWLNKWYFRKEEAVQPSPVISSSAAESAKNLTLEEFSVKYPGYKTNIVGYEYSYTVPEGNIIRVRDMDFPTYTANVYISSGLPNSAEDLDAFVCNRFDKSWDDGAFYRLPEGKDNSGQAVFSRHDAFFVKGETDDTIRLDRINRDYCFFISRNPSSLRYMPVLMDNSGYCISGDDYVNNGLVFTSRFEDGQIFLKAVNVTKDDCECMAELTLKRLDGQVWRDVGTVLDKQGFEVIGYESAEKCIAVDLDSGVYKIGVTIGNKYTETEFYV
ncbi:MAG: hypothetical protein J5999_00010 [Oscillospiraceae bacterium]|nr:hypothetical protein [Oscillospiraceae bacterium]